MGEYFYPILAIGDEPLKVVHPRDYGCGLKQMEHSYMGNPLMYSVITHIINARLCPEDDVRLVWLSDYGADCEFHSEDAQAEAMVNKARELVSKHDFTGMRITEPLTDADFEDIFIMCPSRKEYIHVYHTFGKDNCDRTLPSEKFIDKYGFVKDECNFVINPLSMLTMHYEGGGGTYYGTNEDLLGVWAGRLLDVGVTKADVPSDYTCLDNLFSEQ